MWTALPTLFCRADCLCARWSMIFFTRKIPSFYAPNERAAATKNQGLKRRRTPAAWAINGGRREAKCKKSSEPNHLFIEKFQSHLMSFLEDVWCSIIPLFERMWFGNFKFKFSVESGRRRSSFVSRWPLPLIRLIIWFCLLINWFCGCYDIIFHAFYLLFLIFLAMATSAEWCANKFWKEGGQLISGIASSVSNRICNVIRNERINCNRIIGLCGRRRKGDRRGLRWLNERNF